MRAVRAAIGVLTAGLAAAAAATATTLYNVEGVKYLDDGKDVDFAELARNGAKGFLIANVASMCGYTASGYDDLREVEARYGGGIVVLGAPCAQFGNQEYAQGERILEFATSKGANFRLLERMDVNGQEASALFDFLKSEACGLVGEDQDCGDVRWNFEFFLVDAGNGKLVKRWRTGTRLVSPEVLRVLDGVASHGEEARAQKEL